MSKSLTLRQALTQVGSLRPEAGDPFDADLLPSGDCGVLVLILKADGSIGFSCCLSGARSLDMKADDFAKRVVWPATAAALMNLLEQPAPFSDEQLGDAYTRFGAPKS